jgi:hypothetical protein
MTDKGCRPNVMQRRPKGKGPVVKNNMKGMNKKPTKSNYGRRGR